MRSSAALSGRIAGQTNVETAFARDADQTSQAGNLAQFGTRDFVCGREGQKEVKEEGGGENKEEEEGEGKNKRGKNK